MSQREIHFVKELNTLFIVQFFGTGIDEAGIDQHFENDIVMNETSVKLVDKPQACFCGIDTGFPKMANPQPAISIPLPLNNLPPLPPGNVAVCGKRTWFRKLIRIKKSN